MGKVSKKGLYHAPNRVSAMTVRLAPRKARCVIDLIRGKSAMDALRTLKFTQRKSARVIEKLLESALSNISSVGSNWDVDELVVHKAWVDEGPTLRRFMPRAQGRATRILKRTCHIHLELRQFDSNGYSMPVMDNR